MGKVIWKPSRSRRKKKNQITGYTITTPLRPEFSGQKDAGDIDVQYFDGPPADIVYKGVASVLNTHGGVRTFPNEHGQMAAAGLRMDLVSSTLTDYTPKEGNKSQGMSFQMFQSNRNSSSLRLGLLEEMQSS